MDTRTRIYELNKIQKEKLVFEGPVTVEEGHIVHTGKNGSTQEYSRMRVKREDAVAVFIYNKETDKVVLTQQFRYAIASKTHEPVPEIMAGKISPGEDPADTALRESLEECGYRIKKENLRHIASFFASPGYTSEKFHLYYATVTNADKENEGGGLEEENEYIEVVEMKYEAFIKMLDENKIEDAKTLVAALYVKLKNNCIF